MFSEEEYEQYLKDNGCKYPANKYSRVMWWACGQGHHDIVEYLFSEPNIHVSYFQFFRSAVTNENAHIVGLLLNEPKIYYTCINDLNFSLSIAVGRNNADITDMLLNDIRCDPTYNDNMALDIGMNYNCYTALHVLLSDIDMYKGDNYKKIREKVKDTIFEKQLLNEDYINLRI